MVLAPVLGNWLFGMTAIVLLILFALFSCSDTYRSMILKADQRHQTELWKKVDPSARAFLDGLLLKPSEFLNKTDHELCLDVSDAVGTVLLNFAHYAEALGRSQDISLACRDLCSLLDKYDGKKPESIENIRRKCREMRATGVGAAWADRHRGFQLWKMLVYFLLVALTVGIFGLYSDRIRRRGLADSVFQSWEIGALVYNFLAGIVFSFFYRLHGTTIDRWIIGVQPLTVMICSGLAWKALVHHRVGEHLVWILFVVFLAAASDCLLMRMGGFEADEAMRLFCFVDIPTIFGFVIIYLFWLWSPDKGDVLDAFVSGSIAFQLISSNTVSALTLGGFGSVRHESERAVGAGA